MNEVDLNLDNDTLNAANDLVQFFNETQPLCEPVEIRNKKESLGVEVEKASVNEK